MYRKLFKWHLARNVPLYFICLVLVFGFWTHSEFYQYGFLFVFFGGAFVVFLVVVIVRCFNTNCFFRPYDAVMIFDFNEVEKIKNGKTKKIIRNDSKNEVMVEGNIIRAKLNLDSKEFFLEFIITGVSRKTVEKLDYTDVYMCGYNSIEEIKTVLDVNANDIIRLISFKILSKL